MRSLNVPVIRDTPWRAAILPTWRLLIVMFYFCAAVAVRDLVEAHASSASINIIKLTEEPGDYGYDQVNLGIAPGDSVIWLNTGLESHTVTADNGAFDSQEIDPGESWKFTFSEPGRYTYYCARHPRMDGRVMVESESE